MQVLFDSTGSAAGLADAAGRMSERPGIEAALVLAADGNPWATGDVDAAITQSPIPLIGGVFPQIAYSGDPYECGTLLIGLEQVPDIGVIENVSDPTVAFESAIAAFTDEWPAEQAGQTYLVVLDGLAGRISDLVEGLFFTLGLEHNFIGGGAGSLTFERRPCIITPKGLRQDAGLIARLSVTSSIGVTHGWQAISDTFTVTESEGNTVKTIEWERAADLYAREVAQHSGITPTEADFFSIAKSYPLGIARFGGELVVRDPLMMNAEGELVCVGEVPAGCRIRLLNGDRETLISAAGEAREQANAASGAAEASDSLLFDCISRVLFLGDSLGREIAAVGGGRPVHGAFTLGEVANSGTEYLDFLNKSTVFAVFDA